MVTKADFQQCYDLSQKIYNGFRSDLNESFADLDFYSIDWIDLNQNGLEIAFNNHYKNLGFYSFVVEVLYSEMDVISIKELIIERAGKEYATQIEIKRKADEEYAKRIEKNKLKAEREEFLKARDTYLKLKDKYAELS